MKFETLMLPISKESRLESAMQILKSNPSQNIDSVATRSGASTRTLERLFVKETGMTFTQWKTRLILTEAVERLSKGETVTSVSIEFGYSPSSFAQMFKSNLGCSPIQYCRH
jgi:AraC-like DNA-binding protein